MSPVTSQVEEELLEEDMEEELDISFSDPTVPDLDEQQFPISAPPSDTASGVSAQQPPTETIQARQSAVDAPTFSPEAAHAPKALVQPPQDVSGLARDKSSTIEASDVSLY